MAVNTKKYSQRLRQLCEEYYRNNISYVEFRDERDRIFESIDEDQGMTAIRKEDNSRKEDEDVFDLDEYFTHG